MSYIIGATVLVLLVAWFGLSVILIADSLDNYGSSRLFGVTAGIVSLILCLAAIGAIANYIDDNQPPCAVGHYETRHGIVSTGKVTVPTTYQAYVCDVREGEQP